MSLKMTLKTRVLVEFVSTVREGDSLNMVNATGQCQMSPKNSFKDGTNGIDWGTFGID